MKKPDVKTFEEAMTRAGGIITDAAKFLGVTRQQVHRWIKNDKRFHDVYENQRGETLDGLVKTAVALARGIPDVKNGKRVGWKEEPNWKVLTYLIGKLGQNEGFGDKVDITSNGESIKPEPVTLRFVASREDLEKINQEVPDLEK